MVIKKEQGDLFYRLWLPLLKYANYKYHIVKDFAADAPSKGISPEKASRVANRIWEDVSIIDEYIELCSNEMSEEEIDIVVGWKNAVRGTFGADAIHYKIENGKHIIILGEAKIYTSKYKFNKAFEEALDSILNSYNNLRKELRLYVHEDFLDDELNVVAEDYLNNTLEPVEVHLVSLITYDETHKLTISNEEDIKTQIKEVIESKYKNFDNSKIDLNKNPILNRITYIVFPVWDLEDLAKRFQKLI